MSHVAERIRELVKALPEGSSVTLPASTLRDWLEGEGEPVGETSGGDVADLTVPQLAEALDKSESTIRGWLPDVPGAYRLGNEWRVPRKAWRAYLDGLADRANGGPAKVRSKRTADLGDWRERDA